MEGVGLQMATSHDVTEQLREALEGVLRATNPEGDRLLYGDCDSGWTSRPGVSIPTYVIISP